MESKRLKETKQCWSKKIFGAKALIIYKLCAFQTRPRMLHLANSRMSFLLNPVIHTSSTQIPAQPLNKMQPNVHTIKSVEPKVFKSMSLTTKYIFFLHAEMYDDEITYIHTYIQTY